MITVVIKRDISLLNSYITHRMYRDNHTDPITEIKANIDRNNTSQLYFQALKPREKLIFLTTYLFLK